MDPIARARLNANLREVLAELLATRVKDPRVEPVSLTGVDVSGDLAFAKVYYSVLGDADTQRVAQRGLESVAGFLRGEVGRELRMRNVPALRFHYDASIERGRHIESILRDLEREKREPGSGGASRQEGHDAED